MKTLLKPDAYDEMQGAARREVQVLRDEVAEQLSSLRSKMDDLAILLKNSSGTGM